MSDAKKAKVSHSSEDEGEDEGCKFFIGDLPSELFSKIVRMYVRGIEDRDERIKAVATLRLVCKGFSEGLLKPLCHDAVRMSDQVSGEMVSLPHTEFVMSWIASAVGMALYRKVISKGSAEMCLDAIKLMKPIHSAKNHRERIVALADALSIDPEGKDTLVQTLVSLNAA